MRIMYIIAAACMKRARVDILRRFICIAINLHALIGYCGDFEGGNSEGKIACNRMYSG